MRLLAAGSSVLGDSRTGDRVVHRGAWAVVVADTSDRPMSMDPYQDFYHNRYGWCYYDLTPGRAPLIYGLHVEPECRRQGHARHLLGRVIDIIRDTGYEGQIEIEANPSEPNVTREQLVAFYRSMNLNVR